MGNSEAAEAARRILRALEAGDRPSLEAELERSVLLAGAAARTGEAERREAVAAVATEMQLALAGTPARRRVGLEAQLALLRHLAR